MLRRRRLAGDFTALNLTQASFQAVNAPPAIPKRESESGIFGVPNHNSIGSFDLPPKDLPDYLSPALFIHLLRLESTQRAETSYQFYKYTKSPLISTSRCGNTNVRKIPPAEESRARAYIHI